MTPMQTPAAPAATDPETGPEPLPTVELARWTVTSGNQIQSRGAVVIAAGEHQWEAAAEGNGPVDALFRAVDRALAGVLDGQPRLLAYDVHALAEGPSAEGEATVTIGPPSAASGRRGTGRYTGRSTNANIIGASVTAYVEAINRLLAEEQWAGAADAAGNRKRAAEASHGRRGELDPAEGGPDTTAWFDS